jgi:tripartite ATP-independent transporter DctM subunit
MEWWLIGLISVAILLVLIMLKLPIAFSLGLVGLATMSVLWKGTAGLSVAGSTAFRSASFVLSAVPLFILMAEILVFTGQTEKAFAAVDKLFGKARGAVAFSTIVGSVIFGAISGFSAATCAVFAAIAIPEMLQRGYSKKLACGLVGGTAALDILIPPSILMVIYGGLGDVSIGRLFFAGMIPGLMGGGLLVAFVIAWALIYPDSVPRGEGGGTLPERLAGLVHLLPLIAMIFMVLGTIYFGICTPTEAASLGTLGALLLAAANRRLNWPNLRSALLRAVETNCMVFAVIIGASIFTAVLAYLQVPEKLAQVVTMLPYSRWVVVIIMMFVIMVMGCFFDPSSIICVTTPIFVPCIKALGFDPLWYGILLMINAEIATLTPPVGLNLFILMNTVDPKKISTSDVILGVYPFVGFHILNMLLVMIFPQLALWLPTLMKGAG